MIPMETSDHIMAEKTCNQAIVVWKCFIILGSRRPKRHFHTFANAGAKTEIEHRHKTERIFIMTDLKWQHVRYVLKINFEVSCCRSFFQSYKNTINFFWISTYNFTDFLPKKFSDAGTHNVWCLTLPYYNNEKKETNMMVETIVSVSLN